MGRDGQGGLVAAESHTGGISTSNCTPPPHHTNHASCLHPIPSAACPHAGGPVVPPYWQPCTAVRFTNTVTIQFPVISLISGMQKNIKQNKNMILNLMVLRIKIELFIESVQKQTTYKRRQIGHISYYRYQDIGVLTSNRSFTPLPAFIGKQIPKRQMIKSAVERRECRHKFSQQGI